MNLYVDDQLTIVKIKDSDLEALYVGGELFHYGENITKNEFFELISRALIKEKDFATIVLEKQQIIELKTFPESLDRLKVMQKKELENIR